MKNAELISIISIRKFAKNKIKLSVDNVDFVMSYVVRGFTTFNPNKGTRLKSYLISKARFAIRHLITKSMLKRKVKTLSLDKELGESNRFCKKHTLSSSGLNFEDSIFAREIFEYVQSSDMFSERQKIIVEEHFRFNRSIADIAFELGLHRSYTLVLLDSAISKLRKKFGDIND